MILREIHIDGFGKLRGLTLPLQEGFQVLVASNEQGKTTLLRFVQAVFYGLGKRNARNPLQSRERYQPWLGEAWGGYVTFQHEGREFRLDRTFGSSHSNDAVKLYQAQTGEELPPPWQSGEQPGQYYFGMTESDFALATFVAQPQGGMGFKPEAGGLVDQLRTMVGELDEGTAYTVVQQRLQKAQEKISSRTGKAGMLPEVQRQLEELLQQFSEQQNIREQVDQSLIEVKEIQAKQQQCQKQVQDLQSQLERIHTWELQAIQFQRQEEQVQRIRDLARRREELDRKLESQHTTPAQAEQLLAELQERLSLYQDLERQDADWKLRNQELADQLQDLITLQEQKQFLPDSKGLYPWEEYNQRQEQAQQCLSQEQPWLAVREEERILQALRADVSQVQKLYQERKQELEEAQKGEEEAKRVLEPLKISLRHEESRCLSQEAVCQREEEWMIRRQQERDAAMAERNAKYLRGLHLLLLLTVICIPLGCLLGLLAVWAPLTLAWKQILTVLGIGFATVGVGAAIRRNAFPPARPTRIVETDANANLLREQRVLQEYQESCEGAQNRVVESQQQLEEAVHQRVQAEARLEQEAQALQQACARQEEQSAQVARREQDLGERVTEEQITLHCKRAEEAEAAWKQYQETFLQAHDLATEDSYPSWEAEGKLSWVQREKLQEQQQEHAKRRTLWEEASQSFQHVCEQSYATWVSGPLPEENLDWVQWLQQKQSELSALLQKRLVLEEEWQEVQPQLLGQSLYQKVLELDQLRAQRTQELQALRAPISSLQEWKTHSQEWESWIQSLEQQVQERSLQARQHEERALQQLYEAQAQVHQLTPLHQLERQIEGLQQRKTTLEERAHALHFAHKWLAQAEEELQTELAPQLNQGTGNYLKELTCNRYDQATVHRSLEVHLDPEDSVRSKPSGVFSAGTFDQVYLALRLALTDLLKRSESLPLLCDDPFVNYDPERMLAAYRLLAQLGRQGRQILLVTCHPAPNGLRPQEEGILWQVWEPQIQAEKAQHTSDTDFKI